MFETGMSALVLKICSEYAKALGLNFPPCVQQEINAIAQYVDLHTVKDLKVEQDGSVITITCYTEGEQEKVFTVTLPEVNVDVLFNLIKGSSSVVVDKSEDGTHLVVRLDKSQEFEVVNIGDVPEISNDQYELLIANPNSVLVFQGQTYYNGGVYQGDTNLLWFVCFSHYQWVNMQELWIDKTTRAITTQSTAFVNEYHVYITPDSATQGTLSQYNLDKLMNNEYAYIVLNNELYRLADKGHTEDVWTYVHTGWDGTAIQNKSIIITISTRAWKQVVGTSGGKLYLHDITFTETQSPGVPVILGGARIKFMFLSTSNVKFTLDNFFNNDYHDLKSPYFNIMCEKGENGILTFGYDWTIITPSTQSYGIVFYTLDTTNKQLTSNDTPTPISIDGTRALIDTVTEV